MKSYRELLGSCLNQLCFVIGSGPSIKKAERYLMGSEPHVFRIAMNGAITKVPAEFWFFIDLAAYRLYKDHPNAKNAITLGVENWKEYYGPEVYTWEPARKLPEDVQNLKLLHRGTSIVGAIGMAALLGSPRIVTVGCDNTFSDEYLTERLAEANRIKDPGADDVTMETMRDFYTCTKLRINKGLAEMPFWLPEWVSVRDASGGELPLVGSTINAELDLVRKYYAKQEAVAQ